ncbi:MAG: helix-turn-helix domain-containing protein [Candidatus Krumholzibacteriota bacterium]|nr:helix-turn-helix domain-containing protein [Candidatus Krumholzibacteriota bacterium]
MITKEEIGKRMKKIREKKHMTLKNVEAKAGISATHISEIERGKTSPTIGALIRIANALGKCPAYFIETEELDDVSFVALEDRKQVKLEKTEGVVEMLTNSIPSGKINAKLITLHPCSAGEVFLHSHNCDEAAQVLSGKVYYEVDGERYELSEGDSIYIVGNQEHGFSNASPDKDAKMIWFASERGIN